MSGDSRTSGEKSGQKPSKLLGFGEQA